MTQESEWVQRDADAIADAMKIRFFPFALDHQEGSTVTSIDGDECIDFTASWAVANTGYRNEIVRNRIIEELESTMANTALSLPHPPLVELAERLRDRVPGEHEKQVWFGHSGSEAGDFIFKLFDDAPTGDTMITFAHSYHGQTLGGATLSGHEATGSAMGDVVTCPFPHGDDDTEALAAVESALKSNDVAGLITEPLQSDGGIYDPPEGFLERLEKLCRTHDAYFVIDEVKAGLGRTGTFFAFEKDDVTPDAVMIGKPLGSGLPISAVVARADVLDEMDSSHLMTTAGNPLSAVAGLGTLDAIDSQGLVDRAAELGGTFRGILSDYLGDHDYVHEIRGRGLMQGVEFRDGNGDPASTFTAKTVYRARELGLLVFYVGHGMNVLELTPPLTIEQETLETGVKRLRTAMADVENGAVDDEAIEPYTGW